MLILTAAPTPTTGDAVQMRSPSDLIRSHLRTIYVYGTFGGATAKFQISSDNVNWFDPTGNDFTVAGVKNFEFRGGWVRGVVAGGAGASINMDMI